MEDDPREAQADAVSGEDHVSRVELRPARGRTFLPDVTGVQFSSSRRGYDRAEVDQYVERVSRIVVELEAMRSPDAVIERALADVGEETSAILRRARRAAEEIIADAEAQAGERTAHTDARARELREEADRHNALIRAEAEQVLADARNQAEQIAKQAAEESRRRREEADRYRAQVSAQIEQLAQDRHRLIEDLRKLADQFHRAADRAVEQIPANDLSSETREGHHGGAATEARPA